MEVQPDMNAADLINAALVAKGGDFLIAADIPRAWATGAQAFVNNDFAMVIFREQNLLPAPPPNDQQIIASLKNVVSVVLPTPILVEFYRSLGAALETQGLLGDAQDGSIPK